MGRYASIPTGEQASGVCAIEMGNNTVTCPQTVNALLPKDSYFFSSSSHVSVFQKSRGAKLPKTVSLNLTVPGSPARCSRHEA
ncbi:hypothetical protein COMA2_20059 [Candidatus Nitrospira nitrificans]|uniref:Uncharacterized protein n=1 Tax=Candidatus Nitrospira nitrificans TaxID=1742973 RepID=A0A0S4LEA9_9BACT|nr:hypothetical protein COMA2_20059 [Candidatus Nitrospira nitrificans]